MFKSFVLLLRFCPGNPVAHSRILKNKFLPGYPFTTPRLRKKIVDKMACIRAYAPSGIRTHDPLIISREHEPLHQYIRHSHAVRHTTAHKGRLVFNCIGIMLSSIGICEIKHFRYDIIAYLVITIISCLHVWLLQNFVAKEWENAKSYTSTKGINYYSWRWLFNVTEAFSFLEKSQ